MIVYILYSLSIDQYYVGITGDLDDRLKRHNGGRSKSTKRGIPWHVVRTIDAETRSEAMLLEKKIKQRGIYRWLLDNP
jgi:putative endonuclease